MDFIPHPLLRAGDAMTIAPSFWPRQLAEFQHTSVKRVFEVENGISVISHCHFQQNAKEAPTLVLLHGLCGDSDSHYMIGTARKAFAHGFNVVRTNLRNCGGGMHLTPTLYNGGLSADMISIARQLKDEGFKEIILAGCSLGGNIVLKAAGELGPAASDLICGVATISPSIDLEAAVRAIEKPRNRIYERYFLRILKINIRQKALLYPELYDVSRLNKIKSIREFDDMFTAPMGGYGTAENYYRTASSINVLPQIVVPSLIIISEDDPMVPFESFRSPALSNNSAITLIATKHGGHAGFIHQKAEGLPLFDQFWAENRVVNFCREVMSA